MLFHTPVFFFIFLPSVFFIYFFLCKVKANLSYYFLIISGLIFYSYWNIYLTPIIIFSIIINYIFARKILSSPGENKKTYLSFAVIFNLLYLGFFKYADFAIDNFNLIFNTDLGHLNIPFPLALSFVTFQTIAFLIDVYDETLEHLNFKKFSLFIIFFPQLIAGPIVRYNNMLSQFENENNKKIQINNISIGSMVFLIGVIKKTFIADYISIFVDQGFSSSNLTFLESWLTSVGFTFQIYFDFSGYIDMATGAALILNIKLPKNFNSPFLAENVINFWQRWHITLTFFLTNYFYNPWLKSLKEITFVKSMIITFIVFLFAGLWHGPSWLFVIFGAIHGFGLVFNQIMKKVNLFKINKFISIFLTFNYINISFIFFRAETLDAALKVISGMFLLDGFDFKISFEMSNITISAYILAFIVCFALKNTSYYLEKLKN
tara:strand:- start:4429 stop:5730 length:1302 start_codon:yes stop_codon:yes gene_type:complete